MSTVCGPITDFSIVKQNFTQIVIAIGEPELQPNGMYHWQEFAFNKKQHPRLSIETVKTEVIAAINADTEDKIMSTFSYNDIPVWLGMTEQSNYTGLLTAFQTIPEAWQPYECKFGTDAEPVYYTFETFEEYHKFCLAILAHKSAILNRGWRIKDSIDWEKYEEEINKLYNE